MDVINLFGNISNSLGFEAIKYWVNKNPEKINNHFPKDFILEAVEIVLANNTLTFNGKHFRQILGTTMGTKMVSTYATLALGYLEETMYKKLTRHLRRTLENIS